MAKRKEEWRKIEGYPKYSVSNMGNVKKCEVKKQTINNAGYCVTKLTNEKGSRVFQVQRLVAKAFLGEVQSNFFISHKDGDKTNNKLSNLVVEERSSITDEDVDFIRREAKKLGGTMNNAQLARKYGVSTVAIFKIVNGQTRKGEKV